MRIRYLIWCTLVLIGLGYADARGIAASTYFSKSHAQRMAGSFSHK